MLWRWHRVDKAAKTDYGELGLPVKELALLSLVLAVCFHSRLLRLEAALDSHVQARTYT